MIKNLPNINYNFAIEDETEKNVIIPDILVRLRFKPTDTQNNMMFFDYTMVEGDTPEIISHKFYGTMDHHWVIMFINEKYDYISDFPMSDIALEEFTKKKYGIDKVYDIHHYEDANGSWCGEYYYDFKNEHAKQPTGADALKPIWNSDNLKVPAKAVTNLEYESELNERKRFIRLIKPNYITQFVRQYSLKMKEIIESLT